MALPPLDPANTARYFVDYQAMLRQHTVMFRYGTVGTTAAPSTGLIEGVEAFLETMRPVMPSDFLVSGARYSAGGSNITLPTTAPIVGAGTGGAPTLAQTPSFFSFPGRSVLGRKTRVTVLGASSSPITGAAIASDYRIQASESALIEAMLDALEAVPCVAIDGAAVSWYAYTNLGYNAYWQREVRPG